MKTIKVFQNNYIIRIDKGEKIIESLQNFIEKKNILSGSFYGIGAVSHCTIKYYSYEKKEYIEQNFQEDMEITGIIGNITKIDGKSVIHSHISLSDNELRGRGGHLEEGIVGGTCEIHLTAFNKKIQRKYDEDTQLNLMDF
ncbi:DUF296 domain-containing protein [Candidatus Woesearchaeota archaeon]|nr:DUF296 domain-containing protein [Candidatus Woesearchaeota archaeon]